MKKFTNQEMKTFIEEEVVVNFSQEELAYRRGYSQGFLAARENPDLTVQQIYDWRHSFDQTAPPGSCFEGKFMQGLTKETKNEFFMNIIQE